MTTLLAVLVAGFAGAIARQEGFSALQERARTSFPVGILAVNLSGAFVLGLLFGLGVGSAWPHWVAIGAQTGFVGAYTTYSTWAVDSLTLARGGTPRLAVVNLAGSMLAGVLLAWGGASLGSVLKEGCPPPGGSRHTAMKQASVARDRWAWTDRRNLLVRSRSEVTFTGNHAMIVVEWYGRDDDLTDRDEALALFEWAMAVIAAVGRRVRRPARIRPGFRAIRRA